jgi:hypothetical protein
MWTAIGLALKAAAGGIWSALRALPWQLYAVAAVLLAGWALNAHGVNAGDRAARAELAPLLAQAHADAATRLQQAADALGEAQAARAGLDACIAARDNMATITGAVLGQRTRAAAQAQRELAATRQELSHAYSQSPDGCAGQPVPAGVLGVLDDAAARAAGSDAHADRERAGPAVRAGAGRADDADACAAAPWLNVPGHDGLDRELGCRATAVQRGQGQHRRAEG